jgi:hypothetical protein
VYKLVKKTAGVRAKPVKKAVAKKSAKKAVKKTAAKTSPVRRKTRKFSGATGTFAPAAATSHISPKEGEIWGTLGRGREMRPKSAGSGATMGVGNRSHLRSEKTHPVRQLLNNLFGFGVPTDFAALAIGSHRHLAGDC